MIIPFKPRLRASGVHLLISVSIFLVFFYLVFHWWYPEPFLTADGGWFIVGMIVLVDVMLGPILTFIVFKPGKKGLALDLSLIAAVQLCALVYGITVIYTERPQFLAFSVDRFVLVSPNDVEQDKFRFREQLANKGPGPLPVYAKLPTDPMEKTRLMKEVMAGKPDLEFRAEYYEPMDNHLDEMLARSKPIDDFRQLSEAYRQKIDAYVEDHCGSVNNCAYFPIVGKEKSMMLVLRRSNGRVLGGIDIDPWSSVNKVRQATKAVKGEKNG